MIHDTHVPSLDRLLGTSNWKEQFVETRQQADLFGGHEETRRTATPEFITHFMVNRMRSIFRGGVLDVWLPLGHNRIHMYSLLFAWTNESPSAKLAAKLARAVLKGSTRGRSKRN